MRCVWIPVISVALIAAACDRDTTTTTISASAAPATVPTTVAGTTAAPATITPEVVCGGTGTDDRVYFAYTSNAAAPVEIPPSDNVLQGARDDDEPFVPTTFAPGHVSPAFWAYRSTTGTPALSWTVKGPDGGAQTVTPTTQTPACTDALLNPTTVDTRTPALALSYSALPLSGQPTEVDLFANVVGLPAASVCPSGLRPAAAEVWTDDGSGDMQVKGTAARRTLTFDPPTTDPTTHQSVFAAETTVTALVADLCGRDGAVSRSWPAAAPFERLAAGVLVCFRVEGGQITMTVRDVAVLVGCNGAAIETGGVRIRTPLHAT